MSARVGAPKAPPQRLTSMRRVSEVKLASIPPQPTTKPNKKRNICTNKDCACFGGESEDAFERDGELICGECGTVIDSSNIVSDVTFAENTSGQAVVQGGHIGENQRTAKTFGANAPRGIAGQSDSREQTIKAGVAEIKRLMTDLPIGERITVSERAELLYKLASTNQFTQGRDTRVVAAICIYYCCREVGYRACPVMLMDLAERISVNVYRLGDTYKEFQKKLFLNPDLRLDDSGPAGIAKPIQPIGSIEIESMVERFCKQLEFGEHYRVVAADACALVARMDRDWMITGRRPAGICGACIILAARMHNYRRSVREVVYVVRVADATILQRLEEFRHTLASRMTIKQFRDEGGRHHKYEHDPPSLRNREEKEKKRREKLSARDVKRNNRIPEATASSQVSTEAPSSQAGSLQRDAEGFLIPRLPIDPNLVHDAVTPVAQPRAAQAEDGPQLGKNKKKRKRDTPQPSMQLNKADIRAERALEKEIEKILHDRINMTEFSFATARKRADLQAEQERAKWREAQKVAGRLHFVKSGEIDYSSEHIDESEFADDPEVINCRLTEEESAIKEKIWLTRNEDWLRQDQKKIYDRTLHEIRGGNTKKGPGRKGPGKRMGRVGDLSYQDGMPRASTPSESMARMVSRRGKTNFSRQVNYEEFNRLYNRPSASSSEDGRSTREGSVSTTITESEVPIISTFKKQNIQTSPKAARQLLTPDVTQAHQLQASQSKSRNKPETVEISDEEYESSSEDAEENADSADQEVLKALRKTAGPYATVGFGDTEATGTEIIEIVETDADREDLARSNDEQHELEESELESDGDEPAEEEFDDMRVAYGDYDEGDEDF